MNLTRLMKCLYRFGMEITVLIRNDAADHAVCRKPRLCRQWQLSGGYAWQLTKLSRVGDIQAFIQYVREFYTADPADCTGGKYAPVHGCGI